MSKSFLSTDIAGMDKLRKDLRSLKRDMGDYKDIHSGAAEIVEKEAERRVPVRTGRLKSSIRSSGQAKTGVVRAGYTRIPYAGVIHWGWPKHGIRATFFMTKALEFKTGAVHEHYERETAVLIRRHGLNR